MNRKKEKESRVHYFDIFNIVNNKRKGKKCKRHCLEFISFFSSCSHLKISLNEIKDILSEDTLIIPMTFINRLRTNYIVLLVDMSTSMHALIYKDKRRSE